MQDFYNRMTEEQARITQRTFQEWLTHEPDTAGHFLREQEDSPGRVVLWMRTSRAMLANLGGYGGEDGWTAAFTARGDYWRHLAGDDPR